MFVKILKNCLVKGIHAPESAVIETDTATGRYLVQIGRAVASPAPEQNTPQPKKPRTTKKQDAPESSVEPSK